MPLPLVPVAIGVTIAGGIGLVQTLLANKIKKNTEEKLNRKLAELSYARLEAISTLGRTAEFMRRTASSNQVNWDTFGVTADQLSDWRKRSETADEILKTLSSFGVGAASVYAAWVAAVLGNASTGTAISSLTGVTVITSKLAWFGGGSLAAGGGGMKLGFPLLGGIAIGVGLLTFGTWSMIKAKKYEDAVDDAIGAVGKSPASSDPHDPSDDALGKSPTPPNPHDPSDDALGDVESDESEPTRWRHWASLVILRADELVHATKALDHALRELLDQCSTSNPSDADVKTLASISRTLAKVVDIAITDDKGNIIDEDAMKDAYLEQGARRQELSQACKRLNEAIKSQAYDKAISATNDILSVIKLKSPEQQRQRTAA